MHELGVLLEVLPRLVGLLDRHCDIRPALNWQAPGLLVAAAIAAAAVPGAAHELRGGVAHQAAGRLHLLLGTLDRLLCEACAWPSACR